MLRTHIVRLPLDTEIEPPSDCVACGAGNPDATITVSDKAASAVSLFIPWLWFLGTRVRRTFPMCSGCRRVDWFKKWSRALLFFALVYIGIQVISPWFESFELPRATTKLLTLVSLIPALMPAFIWTSIFPRPVTIDVGRRMIDYEFACRDYAQRFAEIHDTAMD